MKRKQSAWATVFLSLVLVPCASAQPHWVDRVAGNPNVWIDGIPAKDAPLGEPRGLAFDSSGNLYISDAGAHRILRVDGTGVMTTVAGTGLQGFSGDGGPATNAALYRPSGIAFDSQGNLFISDSWNNRIRKIDRAGIITTVAGTGDWEFAGDGGPAASASLVRPHSIALDDGGNLYVSDSWNNRIRKIDRAGIITTVAGTGASGFSGDGGLATNASLDWPSGIAFDSQGNLFISDSGNNRIRKIDRAGIIMTVAGTGDFGSGEYPGEGGPAANAPLDSPDDVSFDRDGSLLVAEHQRIRKVDSAGIITTVAGGWFGGGDCGPSLDASILAVGLAVDTAGRIYFSDRSTRTVRRLSGQRPTECTAPLAPLETWSVGPGEVSFAGFSSRGCLVPSDPEIWGQTFVVHSSEWQRRALGENVWTTVRGTLRAGRICAHSPNEPGEYRAVAELSVGDGERARYRSVNTISGSSGTASDQPRFGAASIADQTYVSGTAIPPLTLPAASGGDSPILYSLQPTVPGLSFDSQARRLSGTPTSTGTYLIRYSVRDTDGDTATLQFTITVRSSGVSAGARRYGVDDVITTLPTGFWTPDVTSGGSFQYSAGTATLSLNNGGYIDEGDYRYTCESSGGCEVVNRTVTSGVVVETSKDGGEPLPVDDDHGDTRSAATSLTLGTSVAGRIDPGDDADYFRLQLSQSTAVAIYTTGSLDTIGSLQDSSGGQVDSDDDGGIESNFRIEADLSAGTHYVAVESYSSDTGNYTLRVERRETGTGSTPPSGTQYTPLDDWTVSSGRVQFLFFSTGRCVQLSNSTINGVTYSIHSSKWQRRANAASAWADIPGTEATGAVCSYRPSESGQYRGVAEISIGGERGMYASSVLTVGLDERGPQSVTVTLGVTGETVVITRAQDGSYRIGDTQLTTGDTVTTSNGNRYRLTLGADGTWTATLVVDTQPSFGTATVSNQTYTSGTPIAPLSLPAASGGDGTLSYSLSPSVPGLSFSASTRTLAGTPTTAGTYAMTYTVRDGDGDADERRFAIAVEESDGGGSVSGSVAIPDASLRRAIAAALGKPGNAPITQVELATLTNLNASDGGIRDLIGLEAATNLTALELQSNNITDVSPLSGLTGLTRLQIWDNQIEDISPLAGLTNLTELALGDNDIADISALASLTNLTSLDLQSNSITDISALAGLTNLTFLKLGYNNLTLLDYSITPTRENSGVADISALAGLTNLTVLELQFNSITDISALAGLTNLGHLILQVNPIKDVSALSGLTGLYSLVLGDNEITDISALAGLTNLQWLVLELNSIADLSPLGGLTSLEALDLNRNDIVDISALSGLTGLTRLSLWKNQIEDISPLAGLTNLTILNLDYNNITDISPLSGLTNLTGLGLWSNKVTDISPLLGLTNLAELELRWNFLNDFSLNDHIPRLESRGVTVFFTQWGKGDFDIELVFLDSFTEDQKNTLRLVAQRWMSVIAGDLPDYEFTEAWSARCGDHSYTIPSGERIDDLRIYVTAFGVDDYQGAVGIGGPSHLRETTYLPLLGCMAFDLERANLLVTGLHEIGHVLGFGTVWDELGFIRDLSRTDSNADTHFNGPLATTAFDDAGGSNYTGKKVPLEKMDGSHWRYSVLEGELMVPSGGGALSAITVQSMADLGYGVDDAYSDPYNLHRHSAASKASATIVAAQSSTPSVDSPPAAVHTRAGVATTQSLMPEDDRLMAPFEDAEWDAGRGFSFRDGLVMWRMMPPALAEPVLPCGAGLSQEKIYVVDRQGRVIRTIDD